VISLIRSEVRRLTSRRLVRVLGALALVVVVLTLGRAFLTSSRDLGPEYQQAVEQADRFRRECETNPEQFGGDCAQIVPEHFYNDPRVHARDALPDGVKAVAVGTAIVAFVVGASYVGADWAAGTLPALLFWEPRRTRVLLAKAAALVTVVFGFLLALEAFVYGVTYLTAATRGTTDGVTSGFHTANVLTGLRGAVIVSVTALVGYAVAGLARHTGAALGAAFVYFAIVENLIRGLRPGWQRFLVAENLASIMEKRVDVAPARARDIIDAAFGPDRFILTGVRGTVTLAIYLAILLGAFYVVFTRRDVT
jgi:ABC-type transport system involved in multi-copper enzyme maturation permease subunit